MGPYQNSHVTHWLLTSVLLRSGLLAGHQPVQLHPHLQFHWT